MSKFIKSKKEKFDEVIDTEIVSIEECDKDIEEFYIDKEKIENIKAPDDMMLWVRESVDKAKKDMKKEKIIKHVSKTAASIGIVLLIGAYNPSLAHKMPTLEKLLERINETLELDEIASITGINKVIPKAGLDENNKVQFTRVPNKKLNEKEISSDIEVRIDPISIPSNQGEAIQYIHEMSNTIIVAKDNRKYGYIPITPDSINIGIESIELVEDAGSRQYLSRELRKWQDGNFDNAVELHNFVWNMLNGNVGKAKAVDKEAIKELKNKYYN